MNYQFLGRLTFKELAARTWRETNEDNILGRAAELAWFWCKNSLTIQDIVEK
jgi:hypothetical protein